LKHRLVRPALLAILDAITGIETSMAGKTLTDYSEGWLLKHGVQRGVEIISEAARRVPPELQVTHPEIPWKQITAIGNILRHNYDEIVDRIIFDVVRYDLPPLKAAVTAIESALDEPEE
jgi:uncharacterized protein with HEPN domain